MQVARPNRALRVHGPGDLRLEELLVPVTAYHEALKIGYGGSVDRTSTMPATALWACSFCATPWFSGTRLSAQ
jgi:hypothetical protein